MDRLLKFLNHERYQVIAFIVTTVCVVWIFGCPSRVLSLVTPEKLVTRAELNIELDTLLANAEVRYAQLDRQDELKTTLFQNALLWAQSGTINPIGLFTTLAAIAGIGATVDNVRKRKLIKNALTYAPEPPK